MFVLLGCIVLVVLRQNGGQWMLVGEAVGTGIIDDEVVETEERNGSIDGGDFKKY